MTRYVTEDLLRTVRQAGRYPRVVRYSKTICLRFERHTLALIRSYPRKTVSKSFRGWSGMTAEEINRTLKAARFLEYD